RPCASADSGQRVCAAVRLAGAPAAGFAAPDETKMLSRFCSTVRSPMPFTWASCSGLWNGPLALRWATMASALAAPTLCSTRSSVAASAVLMLTFSVASALPASSRDSASVENSALSLFMSDLLVSSRVSMPPARSAAGQHSLLRRGDGRHRRRRCIGTGLRRAHPWEKPYTHPAGRIGVFAPDTPDGRQQDRPLRRRQVGRGDRSAARRVHPHPQQVADVRRRL